MKKSMSKNLITVVVPAYNEPYKIKEVINQVAKYVDLIVLVDDGSKDSVVNIVKNSKTVILRHCINLGQGAAIQTAFEYLKKIEPKVIVTFDADGQFLAEEIPRVVAPILNKKVDVVLGSRFLGATINMPFVRKCVLKTGIFFTWVFSEIKLTDTHNGFRALSKKALHLIDISQNRMAHASEIIDQIKSKKLSHLEVPVTVKYNLESKKKGQKNRQSINILLDLISKKLN